MNLRLLVLAIFGMALFSSCGGDGDCVQADWIGTYSGTVTCDLEGTSSETIIVAAGSTEDKLIIDGIEVDFSGCKASGELDLGDLGKIDYEFELDGNTLTSSNDFTAGSLSTEEDDNCMFSGTK